MNIYIEKNECKRERLLTHGREFREEISISSFSLEDRSVNIHAIGKELSWCFPGREFILSSENCDIQVKRGFMYPCSFLSILEGGSRGNYCTTIIVDQPEIAWLHLKKTKRAIAKGSHKLVNIEYVESGTFDHAVDSKEAHGSDFSACCYDWEKEDHIQVQFGLDADCAGEAVIHIIREKGDFHKSLESYKSWYHNKYGMPKDKPFAGRFHMKRVFLHDRFCQAAALRVRPDERRNEDGRREDNDLRKEDGHREDNDLRKEDGCRKEDGHRNDDRIVDLFSLYKKDQEAFGDIDMALLFDAGYNPKTGIRCGNNEPTFLTPGEIQELQKQMKSLAIPFFIYFDPHLIENDSDWGRFYGDSLAIRDRNQEIIRNWGPDNWHPCLASQDYLQRSSDYISRTLQALPAQGLYLDEIGNGTQYPCFGHGKDHEHSRAYHQIEKEKEYVRQISESNPGHFLMCEFPPADSMNRYFPIVLSDTRSILNIYRFLFPRIKYIRIINCDLPIGDNPWEINKSFFNGEGLWLDNDPDDPVWYPDHIRQRIKEQYQILRKYADAIDSDDVEPLHAIGSDRILCNRFTGRDQTLLTLINPEPHPNQLYLPNRPGHHLQVVYLPDGCRQMEDAGGVLITLAPKETAAIEVMIN